MSVDRKFVVVRTHSHTDRQCLWKVMTRTIGDYNTAVQWMEFEQSLDSKGRKPHKFMVIEILEAVD